MEELLKPQPALEMGAMAPGGWLRGPSVSDGDETEEIDVLGLEDDFDRLAQAARGYASEGDDDDELEDFFDDDEDDEEEEVASTAPTASLGEEAAEEAQQ